VQEAIHPAGLSLRSNGGEASQALTIAEMPPGVPRPLTTPRQTPADL